MLNFQNTIISQYANSDRIYTLIEHMNEWIDPRNDLQAFYDMIWNVDTAVGYGLDVWGRIVDIRRTIQIDKTEDSFGFKISTEHQDFYPFNQMPFRSNEDRFSFYELPDDSYRKLIMIKAAINIIWATASSINALLHNLFEGRGRCYFLTLGNMHARYVFEFHLKDFERSLIRNGFFPRPTGVDVDYREIVPIEIFGFGEAKVFQPFNQGVFYRN